MKVIDKIAGEILEGEKDIVLEEAVERVHDYKETYEDVVLSTTEKEEDTVYIKRA